uniref:Uncharacterized protein n=1 Tax=Rhizophora mucronata TaxID=61149 RepID=A0A2P2NYF9_RHIMU
MDSCEQKLKPPNCRQRSYHDIDTVSFKFKKKNEAK